MDQIRYYLEHQTADFLILLTAGVLLLALFTLIILIILLINGAKYKKFMKGVHGESIEDLLKENLKKINDLRESQYTNKLDIDILKDYHKKNFNKMAIVKYSPLETYGQNSFIMTFLTTSNDGIIMNAINSRDGFYLYSKEIKGGRSELKLSEEEVKCLDKAMNQ